MRCSSLEGFNKAVQAGRFELDHRLVFVGVDMVNHRALEEMTIKVRTLRGQMDYAEQTEDIRALTRATATDMLQMEGFIGVSFFRIGGRGVTISAWEKPEQVFKVVVKVAVV